MADKVEIKTGDTYPPIRRQLESDQTGTAIDLTDATVRFHMADSSNTVIIDSAGVIESPATDGIIRYNWGAADTSTAGAGHFYGEFEITLTGGEILTVPPGEDYIDIIIGDDIA